MKNSTQDNKATLKRTTADHHQDKGKGQRDRAQGSGHPEEAGPWQVFPFGSWRLRGDAAAAREVAQCKERGRKKYLGFYIFLLDFNLQHLTQ